MSVEYHYNLIACGRLLSTDANWEEMKAMDALFAIISSPEKRFRNWKLEEFLNTGQEEDSSLMQAAEKMRLPEQRHRAIDFGCGVGRLTRALRSHFPECYGITFPRACWNEGENSQGVPLSPGK
ncbi:MAG: hypothetical protein JWM83_163 [Candidatus Angelobacter sp.]|nr:hypothetical protein [Candidatus Angelobacter sp.]